MNKLLDNANTQEIKLPKFNNDYGDNFDGEKFPTNNTSKIDKRNQFYKKLQNNQFAIISSCALVAIIIIGTVVVSLSSSKLEKKEETTISSSIFTSKEEKKHTTPINNEYSNKDNQPKHFYTEESTTQAPSTAIDTTMQPTTQVTEIETTNSPTVSFEVEATTYIEKTLSVDDISLIKTDDNLFICTANGTFDGYSDEELLSFVSISTTFGSPIISSPSLNGSNFSFYINLSNECDGELCIHIGNYDYYQTIKSMK